MSYITTIDETEVFVLSTTAFCRLLYELKSLFQTHIDREDIFQRCADLYILTREEKQKLHKFLLKVCIFGKEFDTRICFLELSATSLNSPFHFYFILSSVSPSKAFNFRYITH